MFLCASARAEVQLKVEVGWEGMYRVGKWAPVFVTASDDKANPARNVQLEVVAPHDNSFAMRIVQRFAVTKRPETRLMYVPLGYRLDDVTAVLRDGGSWRKLAEESFDPAFNPNGGVNNSYPVSTSGEVLLGVSGRRKTMDLLQGPFDWGFPEKEAKPNQPVYGQPQKPAIRTGFLAESRLPDMPLGYEGLSALVLNAPDLVRMEPAVQQAIADWVRGGGTLLMWPGAEALPADSAVAALLPCAVGENAVVELSLEDTKDLGLLSRQEKLAGRALVPKGEATTLSFLREKGTAVFGRAGFGRVGVLSVDASQLLLKDQPAAQEFWRPILKELLRPEAPDPEQQHNYYVYETPVEGRKRAATEKVLDTLGNVPGIGKFDFTYIAIVMVAMMLIVGPVDWFVLKRLGKQPWTWATVVGWVVLVTVGALYVGHAFKSGDLYYRTVRVIDQEGTAVRGAVDVIGIYSPKTQAYALETPDRSWWEPANMDVRYPFARNKPPTEWVSVQDDRGNRPVPMTVNVWNLRFLTGEAADPGAVAPVVSAQLRKEKMGEKGMVVGTIRNLGKGTLKNVKVVTKGGVATVKEEIKAGEVREVSVAVIEGDQSLAAPHEVNRQYQYYGSGGASAYDVGPGHEVAFLRAACDLAVQRSVRLTEMMQGSGNIACVYAECEDVTPAVKMRHDGDAQAIEKHWVVVRAVVELAKDE